MADRETELDIEPVSQSPLPETRKRARVPALDARIFALAMRRLFPRTPKKAVVACSGGVDSMVLVDLLRDYYQERKGELSVVHLDHGQRSADMAVRDQTTVGEYCERHGLKLVVAQLKLVPGASEARMREVRYEALAKAAGRGAIVFTAHHSDDELETLLLKIIRGAHPETLAGIPARSKRAAGNHRIRLARPLLPFRKKDIIGYARAQGLRWSEDETNQSPRYARNRVRRELIPLLNALRPGSDRRLHRFLAEVIAGAKDRPSRVETGKVALLLQTEQGMPVEKTEFAGLQAAVTLLMRQTGRTTRAHWESLKRQLELRHARRRFGGPTKIIQFPGGHRLTFRGDRLFWSKSG